MENLLRKFWKYFMNNMYNTVHSTVLESIAVSAIDIWWSASLCSVLTKENFMNSHCNCFKRKNIINKLKKE